MHIEQKLSRFLSEMVLAPSLGLKKVRYNIQRCYVYCNGLFRDNQSSLGFANLF